MPTMPATVPVSWARSARINTSEMRAGSSSSSLIHATSAPLANVHDSPHSICVATSGPKSVTRPVAIIAVPMSTWETTSDHFRLNGVGEDAGGNLEHQRDDPLGDADQHQLRRRQARVDDEVDAGHQPPAPVQHRPAPDPPHVDGGRDQPAGTTRPYEPTAGTRQPFR